MLHNLCITFSFNSPSVTRLTRQESVKAENYVSILESARHISLRRSQTPPQAHDALFQIRGDDSP